MRKACLRYATEPRNSKRVMKTHASATVKAYESAFGCWSIWATEHDFEALPATPVAVSLYLLEVMEASSSSSPITKAVAAIKWAHEKACLSTPLDAIVKQIVTAAKTELARPPVGKQPLSKEMVAQVVGKLTESDNCMDLRSAVMFALGFAGFMRWDDMQRVCVGDISFRKDHIWKYAWQRGRMTSLGKAAPSLLEGNRMTREL